MMDLWNDPVWSNVIAGVILAVLAGLAAWWRAKIVPFLASATPIPNWLIGIGVSVPLVVIVTATPIPNWLTGIVGILVPLVD